MRASLRQEDPDYLFWNDGEWEIVDIDEGKQLVCPHCVRRRNRGTTDSHRWNHRGYVAHFSIVDDHLQLDWLSTANCSFPKPDPPEIKRAYDLPIQLPYSGYLLICQNPSAYYTGNYDSIIFSRRAMELRFDKGFLAEQRSLDKWTNYAGHRFHVQEAKDLREGLSAELAQDLNGAYGRYSYRAHSRDEGQDCVLCSMIKEFERSEWMKHLEFFSKNEKGRVVLRDDTPEEIRSDYQNWYNRVNRNSRGEWVRKLVG